MNRTTYVNDFIKKLHDREYIIDPKANEIPYDSTKTISQAITSAISSWEFNNLLSRPHNEITVGYVFSVITSALGCGVVIDKHDLKKQLRDTQQMLSQCNSDNERIQKDNKDLIRKLAHSEELRKTLENELNKNDSNIGEVL